MDVYIDHTITDTSKPVLAKDDSVKCKNQKEKCATETGHPNEAEVAKLCRPIFIFLLITGININLGKGCLGKFIRMFYLFVLLIISIWCTIHLLETVRHEFIMYNFIYIGFNLDHYSAIAILYVAAFKNQKIGSVVRDIWRLFSELSDGHNAKRRLRRWVWALLITAPIYSIYLTFYRILMFVANLIPSPNEQFKIEWILRYSLREFPRSFIGLLPNAFACFAIVHCYLITECVTCLNRKFQANHGKDHIDHLNKHLEISTTVNRFNQTFQLTVLTLISVQMMSIASLIYEIAFNIKHSPHFDLYECQLLMSLVHNTKDFILFIYFGHEIRCKAEKVVNILLDASISKHRMSTTEDTRDKNCEIITLFTARLSTDPMVISAGLFSIDYYLIAVVFSVAATYFTVAPPLQLSEYDEYRSTLNTTYNSSLSASLNDSSLLT